MLRREFDDVGGLCGSGCCVGRILARLFGGFAGFLFSELIGEAGFEEPHDGSELRGIFPCSRSEERFDAACLEFGFGVAQNGFAARALVNPTLQVFFEKGDRIGGEAAGHAGFEEGAEDGEHFRGDFEG